MENQHKAGTEGLKSAVIVGATGLVGQTLLRQLSGTHVFKETLAVSRRSTGIPGVQDQLVDLSKVAELEASRWGTDLFFCFGTTLKQAGSPERFREIEWGISEKILRTAKKMGVKRVYLVSAMGASKTSSILYSRIKGEIESLAQELGFESLVILRPSLLLGPRQEVRFGEGLAQTLFRPLVGLMSGPLKKFRPIEAAQVARALVKSSQRPQPGVLLLENDQLFLTESM